MRSVRDVGEGLDRDSPLEPVGTPDDADEEHEVFGEAALERSVPHANGDLAAACGGGGADEGAQRPDRAALASDETTAVASGTEIS